MSNKKNRSSLTAIALSILLSSTVFAGERANQQLQPEARFWGRWGSHAADIAYAGASYLPAAVGAYCGGLPGFAVGSNISTLLINKRQQKQRWQQLPHERAGTYQYLMPYLLNLAIITGTLSLLYFKGMPAKDVASKAAVTLAALTLTGGLDLSIHFIDEEKIQLFKSYITDVVDGTKQFSSAVIEDYIKEYDTTKISQYISARAFIEITILEHLAQKGLIKFEKQNDSYENDSYEIVTSNQLELNKIQKYFQNLYPEPNVISPVVINYVAKKASNTKAPIPDDLRTLQY